MRGAGLLLLAGCAATPTALDVGPPNILLINADDLGYGDLGCYGATRLSTPNIDRLAREGRRYPYAHSASAVCSPSRYGLLTGRYPLRRNLWGPMPNDGLLSIDVGTWTLASLLSGSGYATACVGKWHLGFGAAGPDRPDPPWNGRLDPGPLELGFDHYFGVPVVNSGPPFVLVEDHHVVGLDPADPFVSGERSVAEVWPAKGGYTRWGGAEAAHRRYRDQHLGEDLTTHAVDWLAAADPARPFFLYFATTQIHHPFTPAPRFDGTSDCGRYGDFVHELDWMVGELLAAVEAREDPRGTLVIFTSDNGGMLNHGGQDAWRAGHRLNGELLGFKLGAWEGGHRVPLLVRWPGEVPAGSTSDALVSQVDLLATFAALTGASLPADQGLDSVDVTTTLTTGAAPRRELVVSPNSPRHLVVRDGDWVYVPARGEGGFSGGAGSHTFGGAAALPFTGAVNSDVVDGALRADAPDEQLYDLAADPRQTTNLALARPEVVARLRARVEELRALVPDTPRLGWLDPGNR